MKEINRIHTPYRGDSPYIFISYSHKDSNVVFGMMKELILEQSGMKISLNMLRIVDISLHCCQKRIWNHQIAKMNLTTLEN